jgi:hypothetical protein
VAGSRRVLEVFMASPSDVSDERDVIVQVGREVASETGRYHGWTVTVEGWERTRPGLGRAQERINPLVDRCDVLVGVLHRRWGTATGEHTSGFEEEVQRVRDRHDAGEDVEMMIYLHEVAADDQEVEALNLAFRADVKSWALYQPYEDVAAFRARLKSDLTQLLNERIVAAQSDEVAGEAGSPSVESLPAGDAAPKALESGDGAGGEAQAALAGLAERLASGDDDGPSAETVIRAFLAAAAQMTWQVSSSVMDIQDLIRVYDLRDEITLTETERRYIARTIAESPRWAPGWGLIGRERGVQPLAVVGARDQDARVQAGAIRQLGVEGLAAAVDKYHVGEALTFLAESEEQAVVEAVCELLAENPMPEAELLLAILCGADRPGSYAARRSLYTLLLDRDPDAAAQLFGTDGSSAPDGVAAELALRAARVRDAGLAALVAGRGKPRALRLEILARSGRLTREEVERGLEDEDASVRVAAARAALSAGLPLTEEQVKAVIERQDRYSLRPRGLERAWLAAQSTEELRRRALLGELGLRGADAMRELLLRRDEAALTAARADLASDDLAHRREETVARRVVDDPKLEDITGFERAAREAVTRAVWTKLLADYQTMHERLWRAALLDGLTADAQPEDRELALRYLTTKDSDERDAAAQLLRLVGTRNDAGVLMAYATTTGADQAETFAWLARTVGDGDALLALADEVDMATYVQAKLVDAIREASASIAEDTLDRLLRNERAELRQAALRLAVVDGSQETAEHWLERMQGGHRFFDVIAALDRLAYAPDPLADVARAQLGGAWW